MPGRRLRSVGWEVLGWLGWALLLAGSVVAITSEPVWLRGEIWAVAQDVAVIFIAAVRTRWISIGAAVVTLGVQILAASFYTLGSGDFTSTVGLLVMAIAVCWMIGQSVRQRRQHAQERQEHVMTEAITAERLRIAREVHDMVAHSIGVIAIQAGMGRRVIDTRPAKARDALSVIESTSREALGGLRRMLGALRQAEPDTRSAGSMDAAPTLADVDHLVATTLNGGVQVDVEWRGRRRPLPVEIEMAAFRIIQEAVTNVVRHADARECRVIIDYRDDDLSVEIVDEGSGRGPSVDGFGIAGMRERADLLNGLFDAGPHPDGGFRVVARLPVPAGAG